MNEPKSSVQKRILIGDTETTGFSPENGDKIIEIAFVEMVNRQLTGNKYHVYVDPERDIPEESTRVHGLTLEDVQRVGEGKKFRDIADDLLHFLGNDEVIFHNAPFDVGFLDYELRQAGKRPLTGTNRIFDTLKLANQAYPQKRNNLDALAKRFDVTSFNRDYHGALVDSEILAQVYLQMTNQQYDFDIYQQEAPGITATTAEVEKLYGHAYKLPVVDFSIEP